jgi:hypothetical protein
MVVHLGQGQSVDAIRHFHFDRDFHFAPDLGLPSKEEENGAVLASDLLASTGAGTEAGTPTGEHRVHVGGKAYPASVGVGEAKNRSLAVGAHNRYWKWARGAGCNNSGHLGCKAGGRSFGGHIVTAGEGEGIGRMCYEVCNRERGSLVVSCVRSRGSGSSIGNHNEDEHHVCVIVTDLGILSRDCSRDCRCGGA